jgi:hypothetical protein
LTKEGIEPLSQQPKIQSIAALSHEGAATWRWALGGFFIFKIKKHKFSAEEKAAPPCQEESRPLQDRIRKTTGPISFSIRDRGACQKVRSVTARGKEIGDVYG